MRVQIERLPAPVWLRSLIPFISIFLTFLLTVGLVLAADANPLAATYYFLLDPLSSRVRLIEVLVKATPLLLTGTAVAFAFAGGYWNIGAEGQLYMGATAATAVGLQMHGQPAWIAVPLVIVAGFAAGLLWAVVPALMKVRLKIDEVVTTLLLNYVAIYFVSALLNGPWRDPISQWPQSPDIAPSAIFPKLIPRSRLHLGFLVALGVVFILWFVLTRTTFGVKMRAVGLNSAAARFSGIGVERTTFIVALVSGGIAGLAGASEVAGIHYHLIDAISPGYGYTGIIIATLGALNAVGVALAAIFIGLIDTGAQTVSRALGVPAYLGDVIQATLLLVTLAVLLLQRYRVTIRRRQPT
ncbi:MAG: ABC transporter permease [Candidatus Promineifilaceae bacterium]|nr:ABC transporter permease [Candidatus Promineifilaceae bacterium]